MHKSTLLNLMKAESLEIYLFNIIEKLEFKKYLHYYTTLLFL